jgi:large conductance mechanosensitive channel
MSKPIAYAPVAAPTAPKKAPITIIVDAQNEIKEFTARSSALDMTVGVLIGSAVTPLAKSLISDIIAPPMALVFGGAELDTLHWVLKDGPTPGEYKTIEDAKNDGAVIIRYGSFLQATVNCVVILAVTYTIIKLINSIRRKGGVTQYVKQQTTAAQRALARLMGNVHSELKKGKR